ncbi:MAG: hypothetical protein KDD89_11310 [Anaerolineales bacterium]|nr:hypothetical protein [Anaerolineales bacterium]
MWIRRLILIAISLAFGLVATLIAIQLMGTNIDEYGTYFGTEGDGLAYFPLTILSFALFAGIWLDKFLKTEILPK